MFFLASKLFSVVFAPGHVLAWLVLAAASAALLRKEAAARWLAMSAALLFVLVGILPMQDLLIRPLEDQYPRPASWPAHVDGILTLGGGLNTAVLEARHVPAAEDSEARLVGAYEAARRYPRARVIFSGGSGQLVPRQLTEALAARFLFGQMGLDSGRLVLEERSRNTYENLLYSMQIAKPGAHQTWLLATSAMQMPRAMMVARSLGWRLQAWPTDYVTTPEVHSYFNIPANLALTDAATHEWIGMIAYRVAQIKPL